MLTNYSIPTIGLITPIEPSSSDGNYLTKSVADSTYIKQSNGQAGTLNVMDSVAIGNDVTIADQLNVNGNATFNNNISVAGITSVLTVENIFSAKRATNEFKLSVVPKFDTDRTGDITNDQHLVNKKYVDTLTNGFMITTKQDKAVLQMSTVIYECTVSGSPWTCVNFPALGSSNWTGTTAQSETSSIYINFYDQLLDFPNMILGVPVGYNPVANSFKNIAKSCIIEITYYFKSCTGATTLTNYLSHTNVQPFCSISKSGSNSIPLSTFNPINSSETAKNLSIIAQYQLSICNNGTDILKILPITQSNTVYNLSSGTWNDYSYQYNNTSTTKFNPFKILLVDNKKIQIQFGFPSVMNVYTGTQNVITSCGASCRIIQSDVLTDTFNNSNNWKYPVILPSSSLKNTISGSAYITSS